jgi:hypothetical protein
MLYGQRAPRRTASSRRASGRPAELTLPYTLTLG